MAIPVWLVLLLVAGAVAAGRLTMLHRGDPTVLLERLDDERRENLRLGKDLEAARSARSADLERLRHKRSMRHDEHGHAYIACAVCGVDVHEARAFGLEGCGGVRLTDEQWAAAFMDKVRRLRVEDVL